MHLVKTEKIIPTQTSQTISENNNNAIDYFHEENSLNNYYNPSNYYSYYNNLLSSGYDLSSYSPFSLSDLNNSIETSQNLNKIIVKNQMNLNNDQSKISLFTTESSYSVSASDSSSSSFSSNSSLSLFSNVNYLSVFESENNENGYNNSNSKYQSTPIYALVETKFDLANTNVTNIKPRNISIELEHNQNISEKNKIRRNRTAFTTQQRYYLLQIFEKSFYPSREVLEEAALKLNVSVSTLQTWFKNTRSKQKKIQNVKKL